MDYEKQYWNERYTNGNDSGYGSYDKQLTKKLGWLKGLEINTIAELGCGDFNFGKRLMELYPSATYWGTDISDVIIDRNTELFPFAHFHKWDGLLPTNQDLLLCVDVLLHVKEDKEAENILKGLKRAWGKYLAITAYERDQTDGLSPHIAIRKFDYKAFGEPIIREVVEEDGQLYFYLWKK